MPEILQADREGEPASEANFLLRDKKLRAFEPTAGRNDVCGGQSA